MCIRDSIELLIVMGIVMMLMGIAVLAFEKLEKVAGDQATQTRLAACASILSEYKTTLSPSGGALGTASSATGAPGNVGEGGGDRYGGGTQATAAVMLQLMQAPAAATMIAQFPASAMLTADSMSDGSTVGWYNKSGPLPVVVDGYRNPIIYVPAGGLTGVWIGGIIPPSSTGVPTTGGPWAHQVNVRAADGSPFWASAGQDGLFQRGDDNLYSCPVIYSKSK